MKIVHLLLTHSFAGTERHAIELANAQAEHHEVTMILHARAAQPRATALAHRLDPRVRVRLVSGWRPWVVWRARRLVREIRPDVAGNADPLTGYVVRVDGQDGVIGGTSAVAPLWAGLVAMLNEKLAQPVGYLNPVLYGLPETTFRDIKQGDNDITGKGKLYKAGPGWDPCTGLGSPNGTALLDALRAQAAVA